MPDNQKMFQEPFYFLRQRMQEIAQGGFNYRVVEAARIAIIQADQILQGQPPIPAEYYSWPPDIKNAYGWLASNGYEIKKVH